MTISQSPETVVPAVVQEIDGVIAEVMEGSVVIQCRLPGAEDLELRLPPSLIPSGLIAFGTPVRISLETSGGYRVPIVRARDIGEQPELSGQSAVEKWINSL